MLQGVRVIRVKRCSQRCSIEVQRIRTATHKPAISIKSLNAISSTKVSPIQSEKDVNRLLSSHSATQRSSVAMRSQFNTPTIFPMIEQRGQDLTSSSLTTSDNLLSTIEHVYLLLYISYSLLFWFFRTHFQTAILIFSRRQSNHLEM